MASILLQKKSFGFVKVSQNYVCMKTTSLFFLLITHGCGAPASWAARHTTVCLDIVPIVLHKAGNRKQRHIAGAH